MYQNSGIVEIQQHKVLHMNTTERDEGEKVRSK